jgi:Coenzyme PQQ synthesis protein D (PqqD)
MPQRTWRVRSAQVMSEVLDGEAVIIDMVSGRYHGAPGVGATVWQAISVGCSMEGILAAMARLHTAVPQDAADQVGRFIDELVAAGLVVEENGEQASPSIAGTPAPATTPWSTPALESHDDLADLLLLDPVHEVTEDGWPHAAPPAS